MVRLLGAEMPGDDVGLEGFQAGVYVASEGDEVFSANGGDADFCNGR
jgi:hypothetical protein